jgi:hypothetical protein
VGPAGADGPGILDRRYEHLAGDRGRRLTLFLVRKHLYFSINEWVELPWWQQRLYTDLLNEQLAVEAGEELPPDPDQIATDPGALAAMGFNVQTSTPTDQ